MWQVTTRRSNFWLVFFLEVQQKDNYMNVLNRSICKQWQNAVGRIDRIPIIEIWAVRVSVYLKLPTCNKKLSRIYCQLRLYLLHCWKSQAAIFDSKYIFVLLYSGRYICKWKVYGVVTFTQVRITCLGKKL